MSINTEDCSKSKREQQHTTGVSVKSPRSDCAEKGVVEKGPLALSLRPSCYFYFIDAKIEGQSS